VGKKSIHIQIAEFKGKRWVSIGELINILDNLAYRDDLNKDDMEHLITELEKEDVKEF